MQDNVGKNLKLKTHYRISNTTAINLQDFQMSVTVLNSYLRDNLLSFSATTEHSPPAIANTLLQLLVEITNFTVGKTPAFNLLQFPQVSGTVLNCPACFTTVAHTLIFFLAAESFLSLVTNFPSKLGGDCQALGFILSFTKKLCVGSLNSRTVLPGKAGLIF